MNRDGGIQGDRIVARYPFPAYPNGWFRVSYSSDLAPEDVKPLHCFGRELVLFRTEAGEAIK